MARTLRSLALVMALVFGAQGCGLVKRTTNLVDRAIGAVFVVALEGAIHVTIFVLGVAEDGLDYEPERLETSGARLGHLDCSHCEGGEGVYVAAGADYTVLPEESWRVVELDATGPHQQRFDEPGDASLTWTDGTQDVEQRVLVREAVDVAVFDLATGEEVAEIALALGETRDYEVLGVDAEGHVLAGTYEAATVTDPERVSGERAGLHTFAADTTTGTVVQLTGLLDGATTLEVSVAGVTRSLPLTVSR